MRLLPLPSADLVDAEDVAARGQDVSGGAVEAQVVEAESVVLEVALEALQEERGVGGARRAVGVEDGAAVLVQPAAQGGGVHAEVSLGLVQHAPEQGAP